MSQKTTKCFIFIRGLLGKIKTIYEKGASFLLLILGFSTKENAIMIFVVDKLPREFDY